MRRRKSGERKHMDEERRELQRKREAQPGDGWCTVAREKYSRQGGRREDRKASGRREGRQERWEGEEAREGQDHNGGGRGETRRERRGGGAGGGEGGDMVSIAWERVR